MRSLLVLAMLLPSLTSARPAVRRYTVFVGDRPGGHATLRLGPGRARDIEFEYRDRSLGPTIHEQLVTDEDGRQTKLVVRGFDANRQPLDERYARAPGTRGLYVPQDGTPEDMALLARALLHGGGRLPLLPQGEATLVRTETLVVTAHGASRSVTGYELSGIDLQPLTVWLDSDGELFAGLDTILAGWESARAPLEASEARRRTSRSARLAEALTRRPGHPIAFVHASLFDAAARRLRPDTTVLVDGERIRAVGHDGSVALPADVERIDVAGKTLLPGLWDLHAHIGREQGILLIAAGVTTVRLMAAGPGRDPREFEGGQAIGPRELRVGVLDGHGANQSPTELLVDDEAAVRKAIDTLADAGFDQVKVYNSFPSALVPAFVEQAHRRTLRTSGHVPDGMKAHELVAAGIDELQHAYMVLLDFVTETKMTPLARFDAFARQAGAIDFSSRAVRDFIAELARRKVDVDLTLVSGEALLTARKGSVSPVYAAVADRLPIQTRRQLMGGGPAYAPSAFLATLALAHALWAAGVPLAVGTDEQLYGFSLERELELYVQAGIPAADTLAAATLGAARIMKRDRDLGSVEPGKLADLVVIDGDPLADIRAVRRPSLVCKGGSLYDPVALWRTLGIAPPAAAR